MEKCPYCGSKTGAYTVFMGRQYYTWNGEPCGYDEDATEKQRIYARCVKCNRRGSMKLISKEKNTNQKR